MAADEDAKRRLALLEHVSKQVEFLTDRLERSEDQVKVVQATSLPKEHFKRRFRQMVLVALTISALVLVTWFDPRKAYEVLTLVIFVPWVLDVFGRPPRPRLHWLPAGVLGGFIVVTYQAWVVYAAFGLLALIALAW